MDPFSTFTSSQKYTVAGKQNKSRRITSADTSVVAGTALAGYAVPYITYRAKKKAVDELILNHQVSLTQEYANSNKSTIELINNVKKISLENEYRLRFYREELANLKKKGCLDLEEIKLKTIYEQKLQDLLQRNLDYDTKVLMSDAKNLEEKLLAKFEMAVEKPSHEFSIAQTLSFKNKFNKNKLILAGAGLLLGIAAIITKFIIQKNKDNGGE